MDTDTQGYAIRDVVDKQRELPRLPKKPRVFLDGAPAFVLGVKRADHRPLAVDVLVLGAHPPKSEIVHPELVESAKHAVLLREPSDAERERHRSEGNNVGLATVEYLELVTIKDQTVSFRCTNEARTYVLV